MIKAAVAKIKEYLSVEMFYITIAVLSICLYQYLSFYEPLQLWIRVTIFGIRTTSPAELNYYQNIVWFLTTFLYLFLVPFLSIVFVNRGKFKELSGVFFNKPKIGFGLVIPSLVVMFLLILAAVNLFPQFRSYYPFTKFALTSPTHFLFYEVCYFLYFIGWEYFFHSFLLFPLEDKFGKAGAILVGLLPFVYLHIGKPVPEVIGSFFAGLFLSVLALETRSFWYGMLLHGLVAVMMDVIAAYL